MPIDRGQRKNGHESLTFQLWRLSGQLDNKTKQIPTEAEENEKLETSTQL